DQHAALSPRRQECTTLGIQVCRIDGGAVVRRYRQETEIGSLYCKLLRKAHLMWPLLMIVLDKRSDGGPATGRSPSPTISSPVQSGVRAARLACPPPSGCPSAAV